VALVSVSALVAKNLALSGQNYGVASTIADDRTVASIKEKTPPLVA
jgi:hypothetical protein